MNSNGQKLRWFRKQNSFSQRYIASLVGRDYRTISSYETGRNRMPQEVVDYLNKQFKLDLKYDNKNSCKVTKKGFKNKNTKVSVIDAHSNKAHVATSVLKDIMVKLQNLVAYLNG